MSVARTPDMRTLATAALAASLLSTSVLAGCAGSGDEGDPEDTVFVDENKADNFYSTSAAEYVITGKSTVVLDASMATASDADRLAAAKKLIELKQIAIAWFLTEYFKSKEHEEANYSFGGFSGIAKDGEFVDLDVAPRADKLTYDFTFHQLAAAGKGLMTQLPIRQVNGMPSFDLEIGKPSNAELAQLETNHEWYRNAPWSGWNPSMVSADKKEAMTFGIKPEKESSDGFFNLEKYTADGVLDIDVFFGWDYHSEYHIKHSQAFFTWLKGQGFTAPVASWDAMTKDTGAFTKTVKADGKNVKVEVRFYFGKPGTATDPDTDAGGKVLEDLARASLAKRDVVMYSGHSGPFYGFALANWKKTEEGDLDDADIKAMQLPADKDQLVLANGCETYQIGEAFRTNPAKAGKNIDVITTMSFSNAGTPTIVEATVEALLARDASNNLRPQPVSTLLTKIDSDSWYFKPMYGFHGIDDNPKVVPWARTANFGKACTTNSQCGGPGNLCVSTGSAKVCTAACASDGGCGTGMTCKPVASSSTNTIYGKACAKTVN
ncbi:MAG TPA: hypothetical protein VMZ53_31515 [Kofleriaceae bacterium]|nr:hypothetical protein [Kofleriaceae bacterium]